MSDAQLGKLEKLAEQVNRLTPSGRLRLAAELLVRGRLDLAANIVERVHLELEAVRLLRRTS